MVLGPKSKYKIFNCFETIYLQAWWQMCQDRGVSNLSPELDGTKRHRSPLKSLKQSQILRNLQNPTPDKLRFWGDQYTPESMGVPICTLKLVSSHSNCEMFRSVWIKCLSNCRFAN